MALDQYKKKRDFEKTPEPEGKVEPSPTSKLYIIQKHAARSLHYDLRLELDGVLKSWAVPKGPSMKPGEKRLAVHVEDHPIEYGSFEGIIPEGEYGGGTVMLWDRGWWEPIGDPHQGYEKGDFKFILHGEKLKGSWVLARMKARPGEEEGKNWLLIKKRDDFALSGSDPEPVETMTHSVSTGRSMEEIASERKTFWYEGESVSNTEVPSDVAQPEVARSKKGRRKSEPVNIDPSTLPGAYPAPLPTSFRPELATLVREPPGGENWIHEIKYDGYRILCMLSSGKARLISRNGKEWTAQFLGIAEAASRIPLDSAIFDGEVVVIDKEGKTDFQALQNMLQGPQTGRLVYFSFDLPYCKGYDLTKTPLLQRKELLRQIIEASGDGSQIFYSDHINGQGGTVFNHACQFALEGIISKQADSPYEQKRTRRWVKVKCGHRQEFVIGGYSDPGGSRTGFGALLLGYYDPNGNLVYSGRVGTGFNDRMLTSMYGQLNRREIDKAPFINPPRGYEAKGVHWIMPELVGEVEFSEWTEEGSLRHPSFKGLREDKNPKDIVREESQQMAVEMTSDEDNMKAAGKGSSGPSKSSSPPKTEKESMESGPRRKNRVSQRVPDPGEDKARPEQVAESRGRNRKGELRGKSSRATLSNPDRVLYPEMGVTKRALAEYYTDIANWILPHLVKRPLTLVRCPEGWQKECFYQKHLGDTAPRVLRAIPIMEKDGREYYSVAENVDGIIALVQIGVLEIHVWGSREDKLEQPDMMIFDLDPAPDVPWERMVKGALLLRDRLSDLGLTSFIKTTGGKGLHIVVPLTPEADWAGVKAFSKAVADSIAREFPREYIATMSKEKRKGKIFVDYLRNGRGATSVSVYSTRARLNAPISAPITWEELSDGIRPDSFNIENIRKRLAGLKEDPWADYLSVRQALTEELIKKVGLG